MSPHVDVALEWTPISKALSGCVLLGITFPIAKKNKNNKIHACEGFIYLFFLGPTFGLEGTVGVVFYVFFFF